MVTEQLSAPVKQAARVPLIIRIGFWISIAIAVLVVVRRLFALAAPMVSGPPQMVALDRTFSQHTALTLAHILPALLFVVLTPVVVFWPRAWAERILFPTGVVVGLTAYAMSAYAVGGWVERSAVFVFDTLFLSSLLRAYRERNDLALKRRWLVRAIAILLGIATTRPVMGFFFATSSFTHLQPSQFFGIAFWIGLSINLTAVEIWLRTRRRRRISEHSVGFAANRQR